MAITKTVPWKFGITASYFRIRSIDFAAGVRFVVRMALYIDKAHRDSDPENPAQEFEYRIPIVPVEPGATITIITGKDEQGNDITETITPQVFTIDKTGNLLEQAYDAIMTLDPRLLNAGLIDLSDGTKA
jgi:hypothetical protein